MAADSMEPMINVTFSNAGNIKRKAKQQQLPNRNRLITGDPRKTSRKKVDWRYRPSDAVDPRTNVEQFAHGKPNSSNPFSPHQQSPSTIHPVSNDLNDAQMSSLISDGPKKRIRLSEPALSDKPNLIEQRTSESAVPKQSAKKSKLKLSIPTTSEDVSQNWEILKKTIVVRRKRIKKRESSPAAFSRGAETELSTEKSTEDPELPAASSETFVKTKSFSGLTKTISMDCEFVGIGPGAQENMLARVSIVNQFGHCIYDTFVKPTELVKDYRTAVSGVRPQDLKKGEDFKVVQTKVAEFLKNRILVGHAVRHDLEALYLSHPKNDIRDTSRYKPFRVLMKGGTPSLKRLTAKVLGVAVQTGEHDSIQDAQAAMRLYTMHKRDWESKLNFKGKKMRISKKVHKET